MYDEKWKPRPVGEIVARFIKKIWWTDDSTLTNAAGKCSVRCFLGEYRVSVSAGGKMKTVNATVDSGGAKIEVTLD